MTIYDNFFFDKFIQFVENDNRKHRGFHPITSETLSKKHECIAPKWLIEGARVLDLGSCIGATGQWCLSHGAVRYVGVEAQADYVKISKQLLGELWDSDKFEIVEQDIEIYLANITEQFDVVFACGIIYGFLDYYGILKKITAASSRCVVIDTSYGNMWTETDCFIQLVQSQHLNKSTDNDSFSGIGTRATPVALNLLMNNLGFENKEKILYPQQLTNKDMHDSYHSPILRKHGLHTPARFIMRFFKTGNYLKSVNEALITNDSNYVTSMAEAPKTLSKVSPWEFNDEVAKRFQDEARDHIPDYERVIDMCVSIVNHIYPDKSAKIIDVGSALGFTVDKFIKAGYASVTGLEVSESMKNNSLHQDRIILSNSMPNEEYNVVLANWTLHFILERKEYLTDIFNRLAPGGILLLSEKMTQPYPLKELYYSWKRSNGVSQETIRSKEQKLKGVLETKPLIWYLEILEKIGFSEIECVNSRFNFNTLICKKF